MRKAIGLQPDAHRVILGAEYLHISRAGHALQCVENIECDVIAGIKIVVATIGGVERQHLQKGRRALLHSNALAAHFQRQSGFRLFDSIVYIERGLIYIRADIESSLYFDHAAGGRCRIHIEHVLDTVDLIFQRCRNSLF